MFFDTRQYGNITVPAGRYDAVRIIIGEGIGKNWWCVLFPPMCVPAASEKNGGEIAAQLEHVGQTPHYTPKFALLEIVEGIRDKLAGQPAKALPETAKETMQN